MAHSMNAQTCAEGSGMLEACAPLANPYVPFQQNHNQTYQAQTGLVRGTIYPGLDLPFMGMVNQKELKDSSMHRLQALQFAIQELGLYLDTHQKDMEALELFNQYVEQFEMAQQQFENHNRPQYQMSSGMDGTYRWTEGPWPWSYEANKEG